MDFLCGKKGKTKVRSKLGKSSLGGRLSISHLCSPKKLTFRHAHFTGSILKLFEVEPIFKGAAPREVIEAFEAFGAGCRSNMTLFKREVTPFAPSLPAARLKPQTSAPRLLGMPGVIRIVSS